MAARSAPAPACHPPDGGEALSEAVLAARTGRFGWFGLSVELHLLVITTLCALHVLGSKPAPPPKPVLALVPIELVPAAPEREGSESPGVGDTRLLASSARGAPDQPKLASGARSVERHNDATLPSESELVASAAFAPVATQAALQEPPPAAVEPGPSVLEAEAAPDPSPVPSGREAAGYRAAGSLGLSLAGFGRGAGSDVGDGLWDGAGKRKRKKRDLSKNASIGGWVFWNCPFPPEAATSDLDRVVVHARAEVNSVGRAISVVVLDDPGLGFGQAARECVLAQQLLPARDRNGAPIEGRTDLFRVVFHRD